MSHRRRTSSKARSVQDVPQNEEDADECRECNVKLRESDRALQCDFCENMYCYKCTRVSAKSYDALCKSNMEEGITWFCLHCRISFNGVSKITSKVSRLEQTQKEILASVQELKSKVTEDSKGVSKKEVEEMVREEFVEQKRIEERKLNIMCFGIEESRSLNVESRRKDDETSVSYIIKEVLGSDEEFDFSNLVRIGKPIIQDESDGEEMGISDIGNASQVTKKRVRPIRITFTEVEKKKKVLDALRESINKVKSGKYKNVFFQQDLTWKQRETGKAKRASRLAARGTEGEQSVQRAQQDSGEAGSVTDKPVLEPLLLPGSEQGADCGRISPKSTLPCLMCDEMFEIISTKEEFLRHLLTAHQLVIADIKLIANFKSYILYWRERFKEVRLEEVCSVIETAGAVDSGKYYLLSDVLPEDKQLREFQQKRKLESALEKQQQERDDTSFSRMCLFCRERFSGNRALLFNHMVESHSFNVGQADNLVYTDEFLDMLQEKLTNLQCLYCEKTFRDKVVLKEHMRKKQHRKINPKNTSYDRFYIINYLELGKNWEKIQLERDIIVDNDHTDTESEDEWSGWEEQTAGQAVCLYCDFSSSNPDKLAQHMQELHDLDLKDVKLRYNLNFYQQVKLINYIRRQVHLGICIGCREKFSSKSELTDHMHEAGHTNSIPDITVWDQPQYFFPTYENDNLLCQLEDTDDLDHGTCGDHGNQETVIAEDLPHIDTILTEEGLRREILTS